MPDLTAIAQALTALKAAKDIAEAMIGLRDTAAFQGKLIEFQSKLIDANNAAFAAQEQRSAMLERVRELERQVADFKTREAEKQKYELKDVGHGAFAYVRKPNAEPPESPHWLCTNCYSKGNKSVLQRTEVHSGHSTHYRLWVCHDCNGTISLVYTISPSNPTGQPQT